MIIVDSNNEIWNYFEKTELKNQLSAARLDLGSFELANGFEHEIVISHTDVLKSQIAVSKLNKTFAVVLYGDSKVDSSKLLNVVSFLKSSSNVDYFSNLITKLESLTKEQQVFKSQMLTINTDLAEVMGNVEVELLKIKKIYEAKAPKRFQNFKGVQVFSKYAVGENIGGEFFDIHKFQNQLLIIMSSTNSYLVSSSILNLFSNTKEAKKIESTMASDLFDDICSDAIKINESKSKKISLELCVVCLNLNTLEISGKIFGDFSLKTSELDDLYSFKHKGKTFDEVQKSQYDFSAKLMRGSRLMVSSPGFNKNWKKLNPQFLKEQLLSNDTIKTLDILDEAFFQLKKNLKGEFLNYDASAIILEVDKNAILKA